MKRALLVLVVVASALAARTASAQDADVVTRAREAFEEGTRRLDANDFDGAVAAFERSLSLRESPAARFDLALAYRGRGQLARAGATLRGILANPGDAARSMQDDATRLLAEIEQAVVHVTLNVVGTPASLRVDGEAIAPRATSTLELDPGPHAFEGQTADRQPVRVERDLERGTTVTVELDLGTGGQAPARLEVRATPDDARIDVDGTERAHGHFNDYLAPGHHMLRVAASGFETRTRDVNLRAGEHRQLDVTLVHGGGSVLEEWWFWTVVGVVVVGAAIAIGVVVANPSVNVRDPVPGDGPTIITLLAR